MHTASELVYRTGRLIGATPLLLAISLLVALTLIVAGAALIADLLQPEPEAVLMAPFRWRR